MSLRARRWTSAVLLEWTQPTVALSFNYLIRSNSLVSPSALRLTLTVFPLSQEQRGRERIWAGSWRSRTGGSHRHRWHASPKLELKKSRQSGPYYEPCRERGSVVSPVKNPSCTSLTESDSQSGGSREIQDHGESQGGSSLGESVLALPQPSMDPPRGGRGDRDLKLEDLCHCSLNPWPRPPRGLTPSRLNLSLDSGLSGRGLWTPGTP